jgi:heme-degrading monooxygenase HmoA
MPFVSVTRLRVRAPEFIDPFSAAIPDVYAQSATAPGNLGLDLLAEANDTFWTRTVWTDRAAMRSYMTSGAHADVMPLLREWCDEAHVAHWDQESPELPTWDEAHRRIVAEGRTSAVSNPSPDHAARTVVPPVTD